MATATRTMQTPIQSSPDRLITATDSAVLGSSDMGSPAVRRWADPRLGAVTTYRLSSAMSRAMIEGKFCGAPDLRLAGNPFTELLQGEYARRGGRGFCGK